MKTNLRGFRPGPTQPAYTVESQKRLESLNFGFKKKRNHTIHVVKTKALISCAVTARLICVFVFTYAKSLFMDGWKSYPGQTIFRPLYYYVID